MSDSPEAPLVACLRHAVREPHRRIERSPFFQSLLRCETSAARYAAFVLHGELFDVL